MDKDLKNKSKTIHNSYRTESWMIGITMGVVIILFVLISYFQPLIAIILAPLILLPSIFACVLTHLSFSYGNPLTLNTFIHYFKLYFKQPNSGSFDYINILLKTIGLYIVFSIAFTIIGFITCSFIDQDGIKRAFEIYYNFMMSSGQNDLYVELGEYGNIFFVFSSIISIPPILLANVYFFFKLIRNFLNIYLRLSFPKAQSVFLKNVYNLTNSKFKKEIQKDILYLNWPYLLLFILGNIGGIIGGFFITKDLLMISYIGSLFSVVLSILYCPFLFSNMEVIFSKYENKYAQSSNEITNRYLKDLQTHIELNEEEQQKLKEILKNFKNPLDDDNNEDEDQS